ncbi:MAG: tRNA pseudouridine(38-40) synthase TruA, partial [Thermoplasmata archaeon]|nr:tRNA pseudouridine(38-40) synthase TruA [Thermoplasmata archaeon]
MTHYALKLAYPGKPFHGSQRQPEVRTVEGDVIHALQNIEAIEGPDQCDFRAAGRTDKGVSALGNVFTFHSDMDPKKLFLALDAVLKDICVRGYAEVGPDFSPRKARERWYRYLLRDEGHDVSAIKQAASLFEGYHDFSRFAKVEEDKNPMRRVHSVTITPSPPYHVIDVRGESFLWNMVRRIVG